MLRLLSALFALSIALPAADSPDLKQWPQFRGPGSTGVVDDPSLPDKWSQTENVAWKTAIPGVGWSSPIIWGERIFVTTVISSADVEKPKKGLYFGGERKAPTDEHRWMVYAVDFATGKIVWEKEAHRGVPGSRHLKNSYASETPVTDGERVYVYFGNVGLFCYDFSGKLLWSNAAKPAPTRYGWGTAASPILDKGRLYLVHDNDEHSYLEALDAKTGKTIWRVDRDEKTNWATPYIWEHGGTKEIVTPGTGRVRSYDLDGKLLWQFGGMSSISIPTPFSSHGLLYIASGYVGDQVRPVYAVKPGARGDLTLAAGQTSNEGIAWYLPQGGPYNPSPLVYGDYYYTLLDQGFLTCHEAATGKLVYGKQRMDRESSAFTASPWAANGKIFLLSEDGDTFVIQAGPEYKLLWKNSLEEMSMATPAIARGSLVIRTASNLYRISKH
jgi:outer membrane protein assembly factor BamB